MAMDTVESTACSGKSAYHGGDGDPNAVQPALGVYIIMKTVLVMDVV